MGKSIKLEDKVYLRLLEVQEKRETFSQTVERLLEIRYQIGLLVTIVEGSKRFQEWQAERNHLNQARKEVV